MFTNLFSFKKKNELIERYSLRQIPLFSALSASELKNICGKVKLIEFKKNDIIYRQGDSVESFYIILSGRCRVYVTQSNKSDRTLAYLHKGDYFGEVSLLSGKKHAANIEAINDSVVISIAKADFFDMIHSIPSVSFQISRRLGMRIKKLYESDIYQTNTKIISLVQLSSQKNNSLFALNFVASLGKETGTKVLLIDMGFFLQNKSLSINTSSKYVEVDKMKRFSFSDIQQFISPHKDGFDCLNIPADVVSYFDIKELTSFLTDLLTQYQYVVINVLSSSHTEVVPFLEQSDVVYVVGESDHHSLLRCNRVLAKIHSHYNLSSSELRLVLYESTDKKRLSIHKKETIVGWKIFSLIPYYSDREQSVKNSLAVLVDPNDPFARTVRFLAREIAGILTGLALGSGAAFGLAHIGVLKVLEREGVKIDIVSGCSIGSVVGALWASGYSASDIEKIAMGFKKKRDLLKLVDLFDLCFPFSGFCKGRTVKKFLKKYINHKEFKHMHTPLRVVATDLFTAEDVVFKDGSVIDAVLASISIPGVVKPFKCDGRYLLDGGVTNPLPISLLVDEGVRKIIAVNILPSSNDLLEAQSCLHVKPHVHDVPDSNNSFIQKILKRFKVHQQALFAGNIVNVLMNTIQYLESTVSLKQYADADIVIHPTVCDSKWYEFYEPEKFIKCGELATNAVLGDIKQLFSATTNKIE
jgi:NTE family protein